MQIFSPVNHSVHHSVVETFFVNVGQGNCTIAKAYRQNEREKKINCWIFDCGSRQHPETVKEFVTNEEPGYKILADYIYRLIHDATTVSVIFSHPDSDHVNVLFWVLEKYRRSAKAGQIKVFITPPWNKDDFLPTVPMKLTDQGLKKTDLSDESLPMEEEKKKDKNEKKPYPEGIEDHIIWETIDRGMGLGWHDGDINNTGHPIYILPLKKYSTKATNINSLCILLTCDSSNFGRHRNILLTGDLKAADLKEYFEIDRKKIFALQAPHHGSENSLDHDLLQIMSPELIFISCHRENINHPSVKTIDTALEFLGNRIPSQLIQVTKQQIQPWHLLPFNRSQYLHELPFHVKNWNYTIPLIMGQRKSNNVQRVIYATKLGLYSTTWEKTYCLTIVKGASKYKIDWFGWEQLRWNRNIDILRDYREIETALSDATFFPAIFADPGRYFYHPKYSDSGDRQDPEQIEWNGICLPNKLAFSNFFISDHVHYYKNLQFVDLRLCRGLDHNEYMKCFVSLEKLVNLLLPIDPRSIDLVKQIAYVLYCLNMFDEHRAKLMTVLGFPGIKNFDGKKVPIPRGINTEILLNSTGTQGINGTPYQTKSYIHDVLASASRNEPMETERNGIDNTAIPFNLNTPSKREHRIVDYIANTPENSFEPHTYH